jgi:protein-S-isoprenylcysteine O-methyltransferase Ste14
MVRDWPSLVIGLLMGYYWCRVLQKARYAKRKTGRAANLVPAEPIGRLLRIVWYPVVAVWIAHPLAQAFTRKPQHYAQPLFDMPVVRWIAVGIAILAMTATLICWKRMGRSWRMGINPQEKTSLVVAGPWAYVRHPIYALSILLMLCTMVILPTPLMLAAGVVHIVFLIWESRREEQHLIHQHGEQYVQYCARVRRFIPTLTGQH